MLVDLVIGQNIGLTKDMQCRCPPEELKQVLHAMPCLKATMPWGNPCQPRHALRQPADDRSARLVIGLRLDVGWIQIHGASKHPMMFLAKAALLGGSPMDKAFFFWFLGVMWWFNYQHWVGNSLMVVFKPCPGSKKSFALDRAVPVSRGVDPEWYPNYPQKDCCLGEKRPVSRVLHVWIHEYELAF